MIGKESLRLGQKVWFGADRREAVVDGLTMTVVGLVMADGGYVLASYDDIYGKEDC
jgi:hypothetical protein